MNHRTILINRFKASALRAMDIFENEYAKDDSDYRLYTEKKVMEEIQAIYYLLYKRNILSDITMNGEI